MQISAVIGSGYRFPGGANSPTKLWDLLKEPRDLLTKVPSQRFNVDSVYHPDGAFHGRTNARFAYMLSEDPYAFDASFFNINPHEADAIDPQHRLLLETVYEGITAAGLRIEDLQGSPTAVYVGMMQHDFADITNYDFDAIPTYAATGTSACILSNRVSYFFDWHGPSMTIDTACSSSLVAVHHAVQQLRSGQSQVAVAAGANLILGPLPFIVESKLNMLSPTGRSRMWDIGADGYARGEGVAAVVLKTLSQALKDGDHIECIIRESGVNQDGKTAGITMPNHKAQEALVREVYQRAGLNPDVQEDRCQYFEAHGTGTQAGDPQEAEAITRAFFGQRQRAEGEDPMYVGSIKTIIGHTEGTAGIAGLLKASMAIQNGVIPPNLLFEKLNPKVAPFYKNLELVTKLQPWPAVAPGQQRRASVNSFGFGGTNAHIIIEGYTPASSPVTTGSINTVPGTLIAPIVLSANTESSLRVAMEDLASWLKAAQSETGQSDTKLRDLAWTLLRKRSVLPVRRSIVAGPTVEQVIASLEKEANLIRSKQGASRTSSSTGGKPRVLGIFTGQGAQWPAMGKVLISTLPSAKKMLARLDESLATLPTEYRPSWTLLEQLSLEGKASQVYDARFSQPLCCAVQILLVQMLQAAGVEFTAVVGHSSGEIACAYAAGFISASQAIRIAYLRGTTSELAGAPSGIGGAMMAAGMSLEDAEELCALDNFQGRICVAASNSPESVTLSGDQDAIEEAKVVLEDENKFARLLKVDRAYHSHHMVPCGDAYVAALKASGCDTPEVVSTGPSAVWMSSLREGRIMQPTDLRAEYWRDNMVRPVLFSQAVEEVAIKLSPLDYGIEVGPHPALKNPCLKTIENCSGQVLPYTGVMERQRDDTEAFSAALGYIWEHFGSQGVDVQRLYETLFPGAAIKDLSKELPQYPFDHSRSFKRESRATRAWLRGTSEKPHALLGKLLAHSTATTLQWQNFFKTSDMDWLDGHGLQGQTVFPGAGYAVMAMEAALHAVGSSQTVRLVEVLNLKIDKAVTFEDESSLVEMVLTLTVESPEGLNNQAVFTFGIDSCLARESSLSTSASGRVVLTLGPASPDALPTARDEPPHMGKVNIGSFYSLLSKIGYGYTKEFRGIRTMRRADSQSCGTIDWPNLEPSILHPAGLDVAFQSFIGAYTAPGDGRLRTLLVPTQIDRIAVNPLLAAQANKTGEVEFNSATLPASEGRIGGDIEVFVSDTRSTVLQVEGLAFKPFSPPSAADDHNLFSELTWGPYRTATLLEQEEYRTTQKDTDATIVMERVTYFYVKLFLSQLTAEDRAHAAATHFRYYIAWSERVLAQAQGGEHWCYSSAWEADTAETLSDVIADYKRDATIRLIQRVGETILLALREDINPFDILDRDGLLTEFYGATESYGVVYRYFADLIGQIVHRHQNMNILEIGAGTGGATRHVLGADKRFSFNSYTFTDISSAFFDQARAEFEPAHPDKLIFRPLDVRRDPEQQEFVPHSYDLIIASNVLHATPTLEETLANTRKLLRPGGHLVIIEVTHYEHWRVGWMFGIFADWWAGAHEGRVFEPFVSVSKWDELMRKTGFSGIDCRSADPDSRIFPNSVFSTHAVSDKIELLWNPLGSPSMSTATVPSSELVIVGTATPQTAKIVEGLRQFVPEGRAVRTFKTLQELNDADDVAPKSTFLVLTELQRELFDNFDQDKLEAMQMMFATASHVLWITEDAWVKNLHQAMSIGLLRTLRLEYIDVQIQCLDVDSIDKLDPKILAEQLVRLEFGSTWEEDGLLWTQEPELYLVNGKLTMQRLRSDRTRNNRLNAGRRPILEKADPSLTAVICQTDEGVYLEAHDKAGRLPDFSSKYTEVDDTVEVKLRYASAKAFRVGNASGFYHIAQGITSDSRAAVVLTESNASLVEISRKQILTLSNSLNAEASILPAVMADLVAQNIVTNSAAGTTTLLFEPPVTWIDAVLRRAEQASVHIQIASTQPPPADNIGKNVWIRLHESETKRGLANKLPSKLSSFFDFSLNEVSSVSLGGRLASLLSPGCSVYHLGYLVQDKAAPLSFGDNASHSTSFSLLQEAVNAAKSTTSSTLPFTPVSVSEVSTHEQLRAVDLVVRWDVENIASARVRPIDSTPLFVNDKTYLLVGLAGDLGRSIARWMVLHGAQHVVLSSRYPRIDQQWIDDVTALGGNIMALPMDVSDEASVDAGLAKIRASMPSIAGVAFGPLVLQDIMFKNMDLEMMQMVLAPKVIGARLLDERLTDPLDFFVMFSSFVMVSGNPGQAAYSAASAFTHALANARRARGLAASTIDIGAVYGVGFVTRAGREEEYDVVKFMFDGLSEQELQALFAEGVVAGRSKSTTSVEVVTGMPSIDPVNRDRIPYYNDPRLSYFKLPTGHGGSDSNDATAQGSVKDRLLAARDIDEVREIITDGLVGKLRSALQLTSEDSVSTTAPLIDQGVDSLSAVTVGGWFSKNIDIDVPVLKILGGASVADLVEESISRLPAGMTPLVQISDQIEKAAGQETNGGSSDTGGSTKPTLDSASSIGSDDLATPLSIATPPTEVEGKEKQGVLSFQQEYSLKLQKQLPLDPRVFNSTIGMFMHGPINLDRLAQAFDAAVQRHDAFRVRFQSTADGQHLQIAAPRSRCRFEATRVADKAAAEAAHQQLHDRQYNPSEGEIIRAVVYSWSDVDHLLVWAYHQPAGDGWTTEQLFVEVGTLYEGKSLPPAPSYLEFASRQRRQFEAGEMAEGIAYWTKQHKSDPRLGALPIMALPGARVTSRAELKPDWTQHEFSVRLSPMVAVRVRERSRKHKTTPMNFFLAAFHVLLARLTNQSEISIGIADSARLTAEDRATMGQFANMLPVRLNLSSTDTFGETLVATKEQMRSAMLYSNIPYGAILEALHVTPSLEAPLFQAAFDYKQGQAESGSIGGASLTDSFIKRAGSPYDVVLEMSDDPTRNPLVTVKLQAAMYGPEDAKILAEGYLSILSIFSRNPALRINEGRLS
ncbi:putative polyketide synthase [Trichoderma velutinum]